MQRQFKRLYQTVKRQFKDTFNATEDDLVTQIDRQQDRYTYTDRQIDYLATIGDRLETDRWIDEQINRKIHKQINRQIDKQIDK